MSRAEQKRIFLRGVFTRCGRDGLVPEVSVGAVMTPEPFTVAADCSVLQLVRLFHEKQFRHFLVTDGGRLAGIISDRDVTPFVGASGTSDADELEQVTVADLMSTDLVTVGLETPLADAIERIVDAGINSLPVVEGGQLVGILTSTDLFLCLEQLLLTALPEHIAVG